MQAEDSVLSVSCGASCFPDIGQELIDLSGGGRRQSRQNVLNIFERINVVPSTCLDDAHPSGRRVAAFHRAGKKPVVFSKNCRAQGIFRVVVVSLDVTWRNEFLGLANCFSQAMTRKGSHSEALKFNSPNF